MSSNAAWMLTALVAAAGTVINVLADKKDFGENLLECAKRTPFDQCLRETLEDLRDVMPVGIPELGLTSSEPFKVNNIRFSSLHRIGGVKVDANFSDVVVQGLSGFETRHISANIPERELSIELFVPQISIRGFYKTEGKVLVVTLNGNGPFDANLYGVLGKGYGRMVPVGPSGNETFSIQDTKIDFDISNVKITLHNLFDGQFEVLAAGVNEFININSNLIIDEVKPQIREEVTTLVQSVMNDAFSKLPVKKFLDSFESEQVPRSNRRVQQQQQQQRRRSG